MSGKYIRCLVSIKLPNSGLQTLLVVSFQTSNARADLLDCVVTARISGVLEHFAAKYKPTQVQVQDLFHYSNIKLIM